MGLATKVRKMIKEKPIKRTYQKPYNNLNIDYIRRFKMRRIYSN